MNITLTADQSAAFAGIKEWAAAEDGHYTALLTGGAGTGKTTLLRQVTEMMVDNPDPWGRSVCVSAPTHKALAVLREKLAGVNCQFATIHSVLGFSMEGDDHGKMNGRFSAKGGSFHEYRFLVIDECSMLDKGMMEQIASQRPRDCLVLFVGDPAQLPPVADEGAALSLAFTAVSTRFHLTEVVRQAADNPIIKVATAVREVQSTLDRAGPDVVEGALIGCDDRRAGLMPNNFFAVAEYCVHGIREGKDTRIIAFTNDRVLQYNGAIHKAMFPGCKTTFAVGERVLAHERCRGFTLPQQATIDDVLEGRVKTRAVELQNNEEFVVLNVTKADAVHPTFAGIGIEVYQLKREGDGFICYVFTAKDPAVHAKCVSDLFAEFRALKAMGKFKEAGDARSTAWAAKEAVANIRHAYALTAHKSQGSTFHTVFVDMQNLWRMRDSSEYNRALYVAITRASDRLAIAA